ncbi:MAG TPA: hypothetical protein VF773_13830 [Verrucomicrobiae bacterium]
MNQRTLLPTNETTGSIPTSRPAEPTSPNPADSASDSSHPSHASHPASPSQPTPDASPSFPSCPSVKPPNPFHSTLHHLPLEQRHQIIAWLQKHTYAQTIDLIQKNFGVTVGHSALGRFHASTALLLHLEETPDTAAAADELLQHLAGHQHQFTDATLRVLEQTAFKLSLTAQHNVAHLDQLNRVSTILCRQRNTSVRERQAHVQERKCDLRHEELTLKKDIADRTLALREKTLDFQREKLAALNSKLNTKNSKLAQRALPPGHYINEDGRLCDNLGPIAQNLQEINDRVRKQFGITPEESARRAELRKTWKNPNIPKYLRTNPPSADAIPSTTAPNPSTGGTNSVSPTSTSRAAANETHAAPADRQPPMKSQTSELQSPSTDEISSNPDALPTPTLNLNPNTSNSSNCVSVSEYFAAALARNSTSTPVAADVRRLTSSSRDAANETTATKTDQNTSKKTQHSELRTQHLEMGQDEGFNTQPTPVAPAGPNASIPSPSRGEGGVRGSAINPATATKAGLSAPILSGEGFRAQSHDARPADPNAPTFTPNSAAPNSESLIPNSQLVATPSIPYPPNTIPAHEAAYFKAIGAQAAAALNEFNARRTNTNPESENQIETQPERKTISASKTNPTPQLKTQN